MTSDGGSVALQLMASLNEGRELPDHDGIILFFTKLLAPILNPDKRRGRPRRV